MSWFCKKCNKSVDICVDRLVIIDETVYFSKYQKDLSDIDEAQDFKEGDEHWWGLIKDPYCTICTNKVEWRDN